MRRDIRRGKAPAKKSLTTTTKRVVWFCVANGVAWVWCSYLLAYLGRADIAENLSKTAVSEIVAVVLVYCLKSLFEKRAGFGAIGKTEPAEETTRDL